MGIDRVLGDHKISGSLVVYLADEKSSFGTLREVSVSECGNLDPEFRAERLRQRSKGRKPRKLRSDTLRNELVAVFGSELSPKAAVAALNHIIDDIKENGLYVGVNLKKRYDFVEKLDGTIVKR
jgi:hypothetical protein